MTADGAHRIVVALTSGNIDFPYILNEAPLAVWPAADDGRLDWASGIGSGGYILKHYDPGLRAQFERDPNYWKKDRAHADQVELITIADAASRSNAIVTGDVHAIDQVDLKTADLLAKEPGIVVEKSHGPLHYNFVMKTHLPPFGELHVRRALKFAVDREELLQKILFGHGWIGNDNPIGPFYRYHAAEIAQTSFDPERAKWHLRQAGLDKLSVSFYAADAAFAGAVDAGILFSEHAARAGITIKVVREPDDGYWPNVWARKPFCAEYWGGYSTEDAMFSMGYSPGAAWNGSRWRNDTFSKLLQQARTEFDESRRHEIYRDMQAILRDDGETIVPLFAHAVVARSTAVSHGEDVSPVRPFDGRRIIERWWVV